MGIKIQNHAMQCRYGITPSAALGPLGTLTPYQAVTTMVYAYKREINSREGLSSFHPGDIEVVVRHFSLHPYILLCSPKAAKKMARYIFFHINMEIQAIPGIGPALSFKKEPNQARARSCLNGIL